MKILMYVLTLCAMFTAPGNVEEKNVAKEYSIPELTYEVDSKRIYNNIGLEDAVSYDAFRTAYDGYRMIRDKDKKVLTFIDFTKPSTEKRLWVIDMVNAEVLFNTHVSHGKNSGDLYATDFSNKVGSYKSSPGFYLTGKTYYGKGGYSVILHGLDEGINDKARERAIVVHGSKNVEQKVISRLGKAGRSLGCPALPASVSKPVIDQIKNGSVMYIHVADEDYSNKSTVLAMRNPKPSDRS